MSVAAFIMRYIGSAGPLYKTWELSIRVLDVPRWAHRNQRVSCFKECKPIQLLRATHAGIFHLVYITSLFFAHSYGNKIVYSPRLCIGG